MARALITEDNGIYDCRVFADESIEPRCRFIVNQDELNALFAAIYEQTPDIPGELYLEPTYDYYAISWHHQSVPPIATLEADGWQLASQPVPIQHQYDIQSGVQWYALMRRERDTEPSATQPLSPTE
jgi:hypothetical protein